MLRSFSRSAPLSILGLVAIVAGCDSIASPGGSTGTPIGIVLMNARTKGSGYTTYPRINFYSVASAQFAFSNLNSDTCIAAAYDSTATTSTTTALQLGAGAFLMTTISGRTDSLYKAATGDQTYHPTNLAGIPFNPGDSITIQIAGDLAGFPSTTTNASTAEPFVIARPTIPTNGLGMLVSWTAAVNPNEAMYVRILYNKGGTSGYNRQLFCDFVDDGQGTVQPTLIPELSGSAVPFAISAQRVSTALTLSTSRLGYVNVISTFEVPTPISP